jgi:hypothetical protein
MNSLDDDAINICGIDPKVWEEFKMINWKTARQTQYKERELPPARELPLERELPPARLVQGEFEELTGPIDDREAFIRHKRSMAKRWFEYYKRCQDQKKKFRLIDQYNAIAKQR